MFIIPCKYSDTCIINFCVNSIIEHHPNEKVVIVDSYSVNKGYYNNFADMKNVEILDANNVNYEVGALWIAYNKYPNEDNYILLQDSVVLKKSIQTFIDTEQIYSFMYFNEMISGHSEMEYVREVLRNTKYETLENQNIRGVFGSNIILSSKYIRNFKESGLMNSLLPIDKFGSQMSERILGICAQQEGFDLSINSIDGNFIDRLHDVQTDNLNYITKKIIGRQ